MAAVGYAERERIRQEQGEGFAGRLPNNALIFTFLFAFVDRFGGF